MVLRLPRASPNVDVATAPKKAPTDTQGSVSFRRRLMQYERSLTVIYRHDSANHRLTRAIECHVESIAVD